MELDAHAVETIREAELSKIADAAVRAALNARLVPPRAVQLAWEYGEPDEHYLAFIVAEFPEKQRGIAYSLHGFGPEAPWGVISLERLWSEMDANWFTSLEGAYRSCGMCRIPPPSGYEVE